MGWWKGGARLRPSRPDRWNTINTHVPLYPASEPRRTQDLVHFSVICPNTAYGDCVVVVGSTEALGNMDAVKGTRLFTTPETFPLWKGAVELPIGEYSTKQGMPTLESTEHGMHALAAGAERSVPALCIVPALCQSATLQICTSNCDPDLQLPFPYSRNSPAPCLAASPSTLQPPTNPTQTLPNPDR